MNFDDRIRLATRSFLVDLDAAGARLSTLPQNQLRDAFNRYLERVLDAAGHAAVEGLLQAQTPANDPTTRPGRPWEPAYA